MNTFNNVHAATSFDVFVSRDKSKLNANGIKRCDRFDSQFKNYSVENGVFSLQRHNGETLQFHALQLIGRVAEPGQLPVDNTKIDRAMDGSLEAEKTTVTPQKPIVAARDSREQLSRDIAASFKAEHQKRLIEAQRIYDETVSAADEILETMHTAINSNDLMDSYYNIVSDGKELVIEDLPIDITNCRGMLAREQFRVKIEQASRCFDGTKADTTIELSDDNKNLNIMAQNFDIASQNVIDEKLKELFGKTSTKWNVEPRFKLALITVKLPH